MANNCTNVLVVRGTKDEIIHFSEYCRLIEEERMIKSGSHGYVICTKCFQRQKDEGSVA